MRARGLLDDGAELLVRLGQRVGVAPDLVLWVVEEVRGVEQEFYDGREGVFARFHFQHQGADLIASLDDARRQLLVRLVRLGQALYGG